MHKFLKYIPLAGLITFGFTSDEVISTKFLIYHIVSYLFIIFVFPQIIAYFI